MLFNTKSLFIPASVTYLRIAPIKGIKNGPKDIPNKRAEKAVDIVVAVKNDCRKGTGLIKVNANAAKVCPIIIACCCGILLSTRLAPYRSTDCVKSSGK